MSVNDIMHRAHLAYQKSKGVSDSDAKPKGSKFVEPTSDTWIRQHRTWHPLGYYKFYCSHDRSLFVVCASCKRNSKQAQENLARMLKTK